MHSVRTLLIRLLLLLQTKLSTSSSQSKLWVPWEPAPCVHHPAPTCDSDLRSNAWTREAIAARALGPFQATTQGLGGSRLCRFRQALQTDGKPLHVVVLGGSLTAGTFLECSDSGTSAKVGVLCAWPRRLERELEKVANSARKVRITNLAKGGTTMFWALNELGRIPLDTNLVFVDYDVNDGALLNDVPRTNKRHIQASENLKALRERIVAASEVLLRKIFELPSQPAIVWVDSFSFDGRRPDGPPSLLLATCEHVNGRGYSLADARASLLEQYGVPRLSIRDAVWPRVDCLPSNQSTSVWTCSKTCHHPHQKTHLDIAQWAAKLILLQGPLPCSTSKAELPQRPVVPQAAELEVPRTFV